jgi:hypothetical protein
LPELGQEVFFITVRVFKEILKILVSHDWLLGFRLELFGQGGFRIDWLSCSLRCRNRLCWSWLCFRLGDLLGMHAMRLGYWLGTWHDLRTFDCFDRSGSFLVDLFFSWHGCLLGWLHVLNELLLSFRNLLLKHGTPLLFVRVALLSEERST